MEKYEALRTYFKRLDGVAVAFSAGVDSTFLLKMCHDLMGDKCVAITAKSPRELYNSIGINPAIPLSLF